MRRSARKVRFAASGRIARVIRSFALRGALIALTSTVGVAPAQARAEPGPIPPGEYAYGGTLCNDLSVNNGPSIGGFCGPYDFVFVADEPTGSTQRHSVRYPCPDYADERIVDYQPDGIHLVRTYWDNGHRPPLVGDARCGTGPGVRELCNPIPAPLILPTGARPGQHLSYVMACAPGNLHFVSIDIIGTKTVTIERKRVTTLVVRTRDDVIAPQGTIEITVVSWVLPSNGLVVLKQGTSVSRNVFAVMTLDWEWNEWLSACSSCPHPTAQLGD